MDILGTGLILIANGALTLAHRATDLMSIVAVVALGSLWWLATVEVEELDRQGVKPHVGRH